MLKKSGFGALLALALLIPATIVFAAVVGTRETRIISPPGGSPAADNTSDVTTYNDDGGHPGNRTNPVVGGPRPARSANFSQDNRQIMGVAYASRATNLVPGDTNGETDVFVMRRSKRFDGTLQRASVSTSGAQANGPSIKPSLDGQTVTGNRAIRPKCVVFQSKATNLAAGDTDADWDVYVRNLRKKTTTLVSPNHDNARDPVVDGKCRYVSFEADNGKVFVRKLGNGDEAEAGAGYNPDMQTDGKGVAFDDQDGAHRQVFYRAVLDTDPKGLTVGGRKLVSNSAANRSAGGNGDSTDAHLNDNGAYVFFESKATDLCTNRCQGISTDRNGAVSDVFRRTMKAVKGVQGSGAHEMQMVSYDGTRDLQADLDSDQVRTTGAGEQACFRSFGKNFRDVMFGGDDHSGPFMHIYFWNFPRERRVGKVSGESKAGRTGEFTRNGETDPAMNWSCDISNRGNFIGFSSDQDGEAGEANGSQVPDMFMRFMGGSDEGLGGNF